MSEIKQRFVNLIVKAPAISIKPIKKKKPENIEESKK